MTKTKPAAEAVDDAPAPDAPVVVVTEFFGVPDGLVYPRTFALGETVTGDLAEVAVREGWAKRG